MDTTQLKQKFADLFPDVGAPDITVRAPGRVNLIGEHTDYNGGFVCPMAIDRQTVFVARARVDALARIHSLMNHETVEFPIDREIPKTGPGWALYAKGSVEAMRRRGLARQGFDAVVDSSVPLGGGLSSSASFEVSTALTTLAANRQSLDLVKLALDCQWAENTYPGVPCGIMDQFISAMGKKGHAMLLDCRDQSMKHVPLDDPNVRIVISNSNVKHELGSGEYAVRRKQCEAAVAEITKKHPQVNLLRDVTPAVLDEFKSALDSVVYRRARHVITEINRTIDFAAGLEKRDYVRCGQLMYGSHNSLRDDYEVSCSELDALVDIAGKVKGVYGARMTGGGFGGCIVALIEAHAVDTLIATIDEQYPARAKGKKATTFATIASQGAAIDQKK